jgi:hypothetical protein
MRDLVGTRSDYSDDYIRSMSDFDPMDINAQGRSKADADVRGKLAQQTEMDDVKWLMSNKRGRRIVWRQLEQAGVFQLSFNATAMVMAFNEGRRSEGLRVLAQIHKSCPEQYVTMMQEQNK